MYNPDLISEAKQNESLASPVGYRILLAIPQVEEKTKGGVYRPDDLVEREGHASIVGCVIRMGPDCYKNENKFPSGPWCRVGDWVMFRSYAGVRFKHSNKKGHQEFRIVNDDEIICTLTDPREVIRA